MCEGGGANKLPYLTRPTLLMHLTKYIHVLVDFMFGNYYPPKMESGSKMAN